MKFITFCKLPLLHLLKVITMNTERRMKSFSKFLLDTPLGLKTCVKRKERTFWEKKFCGITTAINIRLFYYIYDLLQ